MRSDARRCVPDGAGMPGGASTPDGTGTRAKAGPQDGDTAAQRPARDTQPAGGQDVVQAIAGLPTPDVWPDLDQTERTRRTRILWEISVRIMADGPRRAIPSPERGRQFLPFAALQGYDQMIAETERKSQESWEADPAIPNEQQGAYRHPRGRP